MALRILSGLIRFDARGPVGGHLGFAAHVGIVLQAQNNLVPNRAKQIGSKAWVSRAFLGCEDVKLVQDFEA